MADDQNNITKFLSAVLEPAQSVEDAFQQLLSERRIDTAVGMQLDVIGKIVGQGRGGLDDETYRRYLRARIATNRSNGTIDNILNVVRLIVGPDGGTLQLDNQGAAAFLLRVLDIATTQDLANIIMTFVNEAKSGGVRAIVETNPNPPSTWMRWDVDNWDEKIMMSSRDVVKDLG